jgi:hypothetical protein
MQEGSGMPDAGVSAGAIDPRAADVAEAERLLAQAQSSGVVRLPALTTAELWVLCGLDQVLAAEAEALWWAGLPESYRKQLTGAVLEFLTRRGLLRPGGQRQPAATGRPGGPLVSAALGMIVAARRFPSTVVIATEADGSAAGAPRMYGAGDAGGIPQAMIGEHVSGKVIRHFGPVHYFSLLSPARAGHVLALWAARAGDENRRKRPTADRGPRSVDVYAYRHGRVTGRDRVTVSGIPDGHVMTRQRPGTDVAPGPPARCELAGLASQLTRMLALEQP